MKRSGKAQKTELNRNRRDFLKTSSLMGVTGFVSSGSTSTAGERSGETSRGRPTPFQATGIAIENKEFRLVVGEDGIAQSLVHKASGQECLLPGAQTPAFAVTQDRPYENELQLRYPAKRKTFPANSVRREGDRLIVNFELVNHEIVILLRIRDSYIGFTLETVESDIHSGLRPKRATPLDEVIFLQLPVRNRTYFGEWLNVMWDDKVAVNLLATDPYPQIDSAPRDGYQILKAGAVREVKAAGVGAALVVTKTENLLDRIAQVEEDFELPRGVESRRRKEYPYSYYWVSDVHPGNIDQHLEWARKGGFQTFMIYYRAFAKSPGHYPYRQEYPNGIRDLKNVVRKIKAAGMIPGLHFHYNKAFDMDPYVTPRPDPRLYLARLFTLAAPLNEKATTIQVEENPGGCELASAVPYLKVEDELIQYDSYTTARPFQFTGCKRGIFDTRPSAHATGAKFGLLGEIAGVVGVFDQRTSIQEEVAERLGRLYQEAGFKFCYYDGAEDVPPPYWFNVSRAQWIVDKQLEPGPLFSEGACKSHFSWHILTRGNAFDLFDPEVMKNAIRAHPCEEAPRMARDFSGLNFGWVGYWEPNDETIGTQPDMLEFVTSRAAAWNCPISFRGRLKEFQAHPRTPDNLEVLRRWEEVRVQSWLSPAQRDSLKNPEQEHHLLIDAEGKFELVACDQILDVGGGDPAIRAFVFQRAGKTYVLYWHTSGQASLDLALPDTGLRLLSELSEKEIAIRTSRTGIFIPAGGRRYLESTRISRKELIEAFQRARIV